MRPALAGFFAESGKFFLIEVSAIFFENLLRAGKARLVHVYPAGTARSPAWAFCATAHTGDTSVAEARDQQGRLRSPARCRQKLEHPLFAERAYSKEWAHRAASWRLLGSVT